MSDFVGWVFIVCGREHGEATQKNKKTSAETYIVVHHAGGMEEGGVKAVLFTPKMGQRREGVHKDWFPEHRVEEDGS